MYATHTYKPNHADKSGGIAVDVLPTGGVLLGTLKIQLLEQMPLRGDPAHPHFIPLLSRPPLRPRNLPQQPHTMKKQPLDPNRHEDMKEIQQMYLEAVFGAFDFTEAEKQRFERYYLSGVVSPKLAVEIIMLDRQAQTKGAK